MKIKKATVEDGEVLAGLAQLLWDGHDLKELTADFVKQLNDKGSACFLAYEAEAPAGFAQCQLRRDYVEGTASTPVGYLEGILVRPEFRRRAWPSSCCKLVSIGPGSRGVSSLPVIASFLTMTACNFIFAWDFLRQIGSFVL